jgi:monofunctional biosynthetic peptidoglycan transglycosylase
MRMIVGYFKKILFCCIIASVSAVIIFGFLPPPCTPLMLVRLVEQATNPAQTLRLHQTWLTANEISPNMYRAAIAAEDQNFNEHFGLDFGAMKKALKNNQQGKKIKGGSTITQQTAKNLFLWQGRSYLRKALEAYFTILIEIFWSKKRILQMYLNIIEMGNGIYGIQAAAQYYFKKPAAQLTAAQAATIAAILPNPRRWSASKPTPYIIKKRNWILRNMNNLGNTNPQ